MAADSSASPGQRAPGFPLPAEPAPAAELLLTHSAEPTAAGAIRKPLRDWLSRWEWRDDDLDDVVLAVDEAVANVVDHAYLEQPRRGEVRVYAWILTAPDNRRVTVSITDHGRWRPIPTNPGHRGRGLLMMSTCMASLHIEHTTSGTSVTMTSAPLSASTAS
jgi:serine/threonine-protein kinase RsbW